MRWPTLLIIIPFALHGQNCTFSSAPPSISAPAAETVGALSIRASAGSCARTAAATVPWITISFGNTGTGNGSIGYRIQANRDPRVRNGLIQISGTNVSVTQAAAVCPFQLSPAGAAFTATGGSGSIGITTNCNWIAVTSPPSGTGNGSVSFAVLANTTTVSRSGFIDFGFAQFRITQAGVPCNLTLAPARASVPSSGETSAVAITANCSWIATATVPWITLTGSTSGSGAGSVPYSVATNASTLSRTGIISVSGQSFTITQGAAGCNVTLGSTTASVPGSGGSGSIAVQANCQWTASTDDSWISLGGQSGTGNGTVPFSSPSNPSPLPRTGAIAIGGQFFSVTQAAGSCRVAISSPPDALSFRGGTGSIAVTAAAGCRWRTANSANWVTLAADSGDGNGLIPFTVAPNLTGAQRSTPVLVDDQLFLVAQSAARPRLAESGAIHAATLQSGPVAPGLLLLLSGNDFGPLTTMLGEGNESTSLSTTLGPTRVLLDGEAAPLTSTQDNQVGVIVPASATGRAFLRLEVSSYGVRSQAIAMPIVEAAPGIFTLSGAGRGPGVILNEDGSLNSAQNPVARGSTVRVFFTGGGLLTSPLPDGAFSFAPIPTQLPVFASIGEAAAEVKYAGTVPGLISAILMATVTVPTDVLSGPEIAILLRAGTTESPAGVTMSVQ